MKVLNWLTPSHIQRQTRDPFERCPPRWVEFAPPLFLVAAALVFFRDVLFGNAYLFPWDFVDFMYPAQHFVGQAIRAGHIPLWDPYVLLGYPIIGDPQASIFNPILLAYHAIPAFPPLSIRTFEWLEVVHIAGAGVFAYLLSRALGLQRLGACFAGLTFMLGGFFPVHVEHETWVAASTWIPLLFLLAIRMFDTSGLGYVPAIGLVFAFSVFSGYPQTTLLSAYLLVFLLAWISIGHLRQKRIDLVRKHTLYLTTALVLGLAISAIQILPAAELALDASRGTANFAGISGGALQTGALVTLLFPKLLGSDASGPYIGGEITHSQKYIGLVALVLVVAGLARLLSRDRAAPGVRHAGFIGALTLIAFVGSFGPGAVAYRAFELLPFMTLFQRPAALFPFALLGAGIVGGNVCDQVARPASKPEGASHPVYATGHMPQSRANSSAIAVIAAGIITLFYLCGALQPQVLQSFFSAFRDNALMARLVEAAAAPAVRANSLEMLPLALALFGVLITLRFLPESMRWARWSLVMLAFIDLYANTAGQVFNTYEKAGYDRVSTLPGLLPILRSDTLGAYRSGLREYSYLENAGNILGIEEMNGYNPLKLRRVEDLVHSIPSVNSRLFDLLNVKYLIAPDAEGEGQTFGQIPVGSKFYLPAETLDGKFQFRASGSNSGFKLFENRNVLPRFFTVNQYLIIRDAKERLAMLSDAGFDPSQIVLLQDTFAEPLSGKVDGAIRVLTYDLDTVHIAARVSGGSTILFASIPYAPGWNARVNNAPAPVYIADHAFMAIPLKPGENDLHLAFEPVSFALGAWVTGFGLLFAVILSFSRAYAKM